MTDTQWPRFEVFQQDRPNRPFQNTGSVHAPDAEMALLNARDVFVRRPRAHALWVVPADAILQKTAEELGLNPNWHNEQSDAEGDSEPYAVFVRTSQRQSMTHVEYTGKVTARSNPEAMQQALVEFPQDQANVWWVCPARLITRSDETDVESMFTPAEDKDFRMPNQYRTVSAMKQIRQSQENDNDA